MTSQPDAAAGGSQVLRPSPEAEVELGTSDLAQSAIDLREQAEHSPSSAKWYKETATVVSVLAAVISIISAGLSYWRGHEQDLHNRRIEFTALIQRMTALQDDPNDEYEILARLAPTMIKNIESEVSAPEYATVARALASSGESERSLDYAKRALALSGENLTDRTWALRQLGWIQIQNDLVAEGIATYESALSQFKLRNIAESLSWVVSDKVATYVDRGTILAIVNRCSESLRDYDQFKILFPKVIFPGDRKFFEKRVADWSEIVSRQCATTLPAAK